MSEITISDSTTLLPPSDTPILEERTHQCKKCGEVKPVSCFPKDKKMVLGHLNSCRACENLADRVDRKRNRERIKARQDVFRAKNRESVNKQAKAYYYADIEKNRARSREYAREHRDKINEKRSQNRHLRRESIRVSQNEEYKTNEQYRIRKILSSRFLAAVKAQSTKKRFRTLDLIGCSIPELKVHLQSKWLSGMNWENYGTYRRGQPMTWHIDHIRPCASFDLTDPEQQRECFHYTNLQPLWAIDNIRKFNSVPSDSISFK